MVFLIYTNLIAVQSNNLKPFKSVSCLLGKPNGFAPRYSFKRLFYFLYGFRQGALAISLHGLNPRNTVHLYTRMQNTTELGLGIGKAIGNSGGKLGQLYKRINPSSELGRFLLFKIN